MTVARVDRISAGETPASWGRGCGPAAPQDIARPVLSLALWLSLGLSVDALVAAVSLFVK